MKKIVVLLLTLALAIGACAFAQAEETQIYLAPTDAKTDYRTMQQHENIQHFTGEFDGLERSWYLYFPEDYTGDEAWPLVITLHGGGSGIPFNNMLIRSSWAFVADREKFIVLYPDCLSFEPSITWNPWYGNDSHSTEESPDDVSFLSQLLDKVLSEYNIDETAVYLHGQSMGDAMGTTWLFAEGSRFAAAATLSNPTNTDVLFTSEGDLNYEMTASLPLLREIGMNDVKTKTSFVNVNGQQSLTLEGDVDREAIEFNLKSLIQPNLDMWINKNGASNQPQFKIEDNKSIAIFPAENNCDVVFMTIFNGEHNPTPDLMDYIWTRFFSQYRRVDGEIVKAPGNESLKPDKNAVAVMLGTNQALFDNTVVTMSNEAELSDDGTVLVPVSFLEQAFPGTKVKLSENNMSAVITYNGNTLQLSKGNRIVVLNNRIRDMHLINFTNGELMVPLADLAAKFYELEVYNLDDVWYITDQKAVVTEYMACELRCVLGMDTLPSIAEAYDMYTKVMNAK